MEKMLICNSQDLNSIKFPVKFISDQDEPNECLTLANNAACNALLNCLLREFAFPAQLVHYEWPQNLSGIKLSEMAKSDHLPLHFQLNGINLFALVDRCCPLATHRLMSAIYCFSTAASKWLPVDDVKLLGELALTAIRPGNAQNAKDLLEQIVQSRNAIAQILENRMNPLKKESVLDDFLASEQGLLFGHFAHPAPKARLCPLNGSTLADFWPEKRVPIRLHLLEVPKDGLFIASTGISEEDVLNGQADQSEARLGHVLLALHPMQFKLMKRDERMQRLLLAGIIRDFGPIGFLAHPTSSVRTMYVHDHPFQLKCALNIRITNCIRVNSPKKLETLEAIGQCVDFIESECADTLEGIRLIKEIAGLSWAPTKEQMEEVGTELNEDDANWFRENTGIILRENFCRLSADQEGIRILLTATLFSANFDGSQRNVLQLLASLQHSLDEEEIIGWFNSYQQMLVRPLLKAFFRHGLVTEPHLQNVLVEIDDNGMPQSVLLRDWEGFRFIQGSALLNKIESALSQRAAQHLTYSRQNAWQRIAYCLFANNLAASALALTFDRPRLSEHLWGQIKISLEKLCVELEAEKLDVCELRQLLSEGHLPCKSNLKRTSLIGWLNTNICKLLGEIE